MLMLAVLYLVSTLFAPYSPAPGLAGVMYVAILVAARRARTIVVPAVIMLATLTVGFLVGVFTNKANLEGGVHATNLLLPAFAVYLLGPRRALLFTLFIAVFMDGVHPLYLMDRLDLASLPAESFSLSRFWVRHVMAGLAFLGIWGLGALHSTARDAAQRSLERALKELRDSESKLSSIIESTDDLVVSLDTEGRLLVGQLGRRSASTSGSSARSPSWASPSSATRSRSGAQLWKARLAQVLQGQRLRYEETYELGDSRRRAGHQPPPHPARRAARPWG